MTLTASAVIRNAPPHTFVRVADLPGRPEAARQAASRAAKAGELVAVRRGLYYRGVLTRYGMTRPKLDELAHEVAGGRGVGPAGFSAARAWGVTTQVPPVYTLAVPNPIEPIDGVHLVTRRNIARAELSSLEIALLEVLRDPAVFVEAGWPVLVDRVRSAIRTEHIRPSALLDAARHESSKSVRTFLIRVLEEAGTRRGDHQSARDAQDRVTE
jgi:hypothetical protein